MILIVPIRIFYTLTHWREIFYTGNWLLTAFVWTMANKCKGSFHICVKEKSVPILTVFCLWTGPFKTCCIMSLWILNITSVGLYCSCIIHSAWHERYIYDYIFKEASSELFPILLYIHYYGLKACWRINL